MGHFPPLIKFLQNRVLYLLDLFETALATEMIGFALFSCALLTLGINRTNDIHSGI